MLHVLRRGCVVPQPRQQHVLAPCERVGVVHRGLVGPGGRHRSRRRRRRSRHVRVERPGRLVREYRNDKQNKVILALIYYPDNQISFHAPEACLGGVGYTIMAEEIKTLKFSTHDSLRVKALHYNRNQMREIIYYFYETNNFVTPNYLTFRWQMLLNQVKHKSSIKIT